MLALRGLGLDAPCDALMSALREDYERFLHTPYAHMSVEATVEALMEAEGTAQWWVMLRLALLDEQATSYIAQVLKDGNAQEQYRLVRYIRETNERRHDVLLRELALNASAHPTARTGALYALATNAQDAAFARRILEIAQDADSAPLRRACLASLASTDISMYSSALDALAHHDDPFTRVYAARLLPAQKSPDAVAALTALARHDDHLVRQESYAALGHAAHPSVRPLLESALREERNAGAARTARIAMRMHEAPDSIVSGAHGDDWECFEWVESLFRQDTHRGVKALAVLGAEESAVGLLSRLRLLVMMLAGGQAEAFRHAIQALGLDTYTGSGVLHRSKYHLPSHDLLTWEALRLSNNTCAVPAASLEAFAQGVLDEDRTIRPINHAYNPVSGRGFFGRIGPGGPARRYAARLLSRLDRRCADNALTISESREAWHLAGRIHHLHQDMGSPAHVFSVWHAFRDCLFEEYWREHVDAISPIIRSQVMTAVSPPSLPDSALAHLDAFSRDRAIQHVGNLSDTLLEHMDALTWLSYFRASFWGEIQFADATVPEDSAPTAFDDGAAPALPNILSRMFAGNIRYHTSWLGDYFTITDRMGNVFIHNRCFLLDDWRPAENPRRLQSLDGHARVVDPDAMRITGRFIFTQRGSNTPWCYPHAYPGGASMDTHLVHYYGEMLLPSAAAYGAGWLKALAREYPCLFAPPETKLRETARDRAGTLDTLIGYLRTWLLGHSADDHRETSSSEIIHTEEGDTAYRRLEQWPLLNAVQELPFVPRCGCRR